MNEKANGNEVETEVGTQGIPDEGILSAANKMVINLEVRNMNVRTFKDKAVAEVLFGLVTIN